MEVYDGNVHETDALEDSHNEPMDIEDAVTGIARSKKRFRVSATFIARRFHLSCDRFLFRACFREDSLNPVGKTVNESEKLVGAMQEAFLEKGRQWERLLCRKISEEHF